MNSAQTLWWTQARSDYAIFVLLRRSGTHECHLLHYLQMSTEKISKAYLWRSGNAPPKAHTGFLRFLKALASAQYADSRRVCRVFGFGRAKDLEQWVASVQQLVRSLQDIAPAEAGNGPNPEYPWPHEAPTDCPAEFSFEMWKDLTGSGQGRKLMEFIGQAITRFDQYA